MITTIGRELIRGKLPEGYKDWADKTLDKKAIASLMTKLALDDPDRYVDILQDLGGMAEDVVSLYGRDAALSYVDIMPDKATVALNRQLRSAIDKVLDDDALSEEQKEQRILDLGYRYTGKIQEAVFSDQDRRHTALASQINSGSRGNKTQLMQLMFGNMMMKDALNRDIPYLHMDPYVFGTTPFSYWVSSSSGRKGMYDVQAATGQAGYLSKQVTNVTHDVTIDQEDCGTTDTGVPFKAADAQNIGRVLLVPFHKHPAGSVVDAKMVAEADDDEEMILRTPMTCKSRHGVCAHCNGLNEFGKFPGIGDYVSLNSCRAFTEKVTQSGISCLHPDTLVRMADWSVKAIKDICAGDTVIGVDTHGRGRPVQVLRTYNHGPMPMYTIGFGQGFKTSRKAYITATMEHKALQTTCKPACEDEALDHVPRILPLGMKTAKSSAVPMQSIEPWRGRHVPEALFLGLMAGDGSRTSGVESELRFSCADPSLVADTEEYMRSIGLRFEICEGSECCWRVSSCEDAHAPGKPARRSPAWVYTGAAGLCSGYAHEKTFPEGYQAWDSDSMSAFVSGLLTTGGSLFRAAKSREPRVSFVSASEALARTLCDMLCRYCGMIPPAVHESGKDDGCHRRTMYCVTYGRKADVLKLLEFVKLYGVKESLRIEYIEELRAWRKTAPVAETQLEWRRQSQTYAGMCEALDIEVDHPDHLFLLANGLVVSNSKHGSGIGGRKNVDPEGEDQPSGFANIERMFQAQQAFPGGAVLAPMDGTVVGIKPAAQGGSYITVGTQTMYCSPERTFKVRPGDKVSAGDVLTNGVPNPAEVVRYKGIGEGRRYYMEKLGDIFRRSGFGVDRSNLESFSRAALNKVKITDPDGYRDWLPGDIADYSDIAADWQPRDDAKEDTPDRSVGRYLERPVLYYSLGTRITPHVAKELDKYGFKSVLANARPLPFESQFMRPAAAMQNDRHWLPRMAGERLYDSLFDAARKGITDEYDSPSYVDRIVAAPFKQ